jgi:hypothetical protein
MSLFADKVFALNIAVNSDPECLYGLSLTIPSKCKLCYKTGMYERVLRKCHSSIEYLNKWSQVQDLHLELHQVNF